MPTGNLPAPREGLCSTTPSVRPTRSCVVSSEPQNVHSANGPSFMLVDRDKIGLKTFLFITSDSFLVPSPSILLSNLDVIQVTGLLKQSDGFTMNRLQATKNI